ncbi:MAG: addiction module protein [Planctomycetes bacterium]|nr:addiction module protein [Planctomycetota bacterium]
MIGMAYTWEDLKKLSVAERLRLLETIWESLEDDTASPRSPTSSSMSWKHAGQST